MGLQQHDAGLAYPLGLSAGDELVDDALRHIVEVSELRLPQHQCVGVRHGVAYFETEHTCEPFQGYSIVQTGCVLA